MRKAILFAAALLTLPVLPAVAADNGFYLGGSVGQANLKIDDLTGRHFCRTTISTPTTRRSS